MPEKINVISENGQKVEAELIAAFEVPDFTRKYVIYTFNELDPNGLKKLNVSQLVEENGNYSLKTIETDDEWSRIKNIMREIITGGNA